jgi:hypothetical protein
MGPGSRQRWIACTGVVAGIAVVLAYSAGRATPASPGAIPDRPTTAAEGKVLARAEQLLVQACMRRAGLRYWVVDPPDPAPGHRGGDYVVGDLAWARRHGYGTDLARQQDRAARTDPNSRYFASLSPARQQAALVALNGPSPEGLQTTLPNGIRVQHSDRGCSSAAQRHLYGDLAAWFGTTKLAENLAGERHGLVVQDPAFTAAVTAWSGCMHQRGHEADSPADTRRRFADPATAPSRDTELALAVDEARCATSTGLADTAERLDAHYAGLQNRYQAALAERRHLQRAALPRALALVRAAGHEERSTWSAPTLEHPERRGVRP